MSIIVWIVRDIHSGQRQLCFKMLLVKKKVEIFGIMETKTRMKKFVFRHSMDMEWDLMHNIDDSELNTRDSNLIRVEEIIMVLPTT